MKASERATRNSARGPLKSVDQAAANSSASTLANLSVENCVLRPLDRAVSEVDREHCVIRSQLGAQPGSNHVVFSPLGIDAVADLGDMLVPRALQVIPPDRD